MLLIGGFGVSTHSRLKAAGKTANRVKMINRFNTQPPEGGWLSNESQPFKIEVSTHSRLKAAGGVMMDPWATPKGFNTQPPEGGWGRCCGRCVAGLVSTHSRLKAAGFWPVMNYPKKKFQHTAA